MLGAAFGDNDFDRCRIVVAFAKRGGVRRLLPHIEPFRAKGRSVSVVVGVDMRGTSTEALQLLLASVDHAYVTYDPDQRCTFHPKMFLFDGPKRALAFVGSHNMTAGGLELNYEAGVAVDLDLPADGVTWTKGFEASWTELMPAVHPSTALLTQLLIDDLVAAGLVVSEAQLQKERTAVKAAAAASGVKLPFVSAGVAPATAVAAGPPKPSAAAPPVTPSAASPVKVAPQAVPGAVVRQKDVLLMRVRPRRTGSQLQISMVVRESPFMKSAQEVVSVRGFRRKIGYDYVQREGVKKKNTARFEAPEMEGVKNPVARFQWVDAADSGGGAHKVLQYEIFDADISSDEGSRIFEKLKEGIATPPVTDLAQMSHEGTVLSKKDIKKAQWYRLFAG